MQSRSLKLFLSFLVTGFMVVACGGTTQMADANGNCTEDFMVEHNNKVAEINQLAVEALRHRQNGRRTDALSTLQSAKEKCLDYHSTMKTGDSCVDATGRTFGEANWLSNCDRLQTMINSL